ncbi:MAG: AAA family ATPase [bacterium]|nr:AAA family ATPase [bacterium]
MRLDELWIDEFKNLRNITVDFDEESPYTVLVGENGSGKSNFIEALAWIFRSLDLEEPTPFSYEIKYRCRGVDVRVKAAKGSAPEFWEKPTGTTAYEGLPKSKFMSVDDDERPNYRPAFVFGYYSGPSDRLASLFERHRERFYRLIIQPQARRATQTVHSNALRRLFYAQTLHGQFALIAFFMKATGGDEDRKFLRDHLQIEGLDSVLFALRRPPWRHSGGDPRFWNAEGEVREFLGRLFDASMVPMRMDRRIPMDLTKNPSVECLYLFLPDVSALKRVYESYENQYAFFTALESTHISKLLSEARTRVRVSRAAGGRAITYRDLSEGEQQLLLVLGLLKFTAEEESLFLLDEPDTHLNPAWSVQYLGFLDRFIERRESCHMVIATHDPLVFSRLLKSQVRIFRRDDSGKVHVEEPQQDPRGMGVQAILMSDLFRLRSTLDLDTQHDLDRQRQLSSKQQPLTSAEKAELQSLNTNLCHLGLTSRDPLYDLFLKKWSEREKPEWTKTTELTPEQQREREDLAADIARELAAEQSCE